LKLKKIFVFLISGLAAVHLCCGVVWAKIEKKDIKSTVLSHFSIEKNSGDDSILQQKDAIVSLRFAWNIPVNAAAFERYGKFWMVFDRYNSVNINDLKKEARGLAKNIYVLPHPVGNIIIVEPEKGVKFALRKEGLLWIMDLYVGRAPKYERSDITIFTQFDSFKNSYLFMPMNFSGNVISILDPDYGDAISILTTSQLGLGNSTFYRYHDFDILETMQGMAFVINAPDVVLNRGNSGVTLKAIGRSLNITSDLESLKQQQNLKSDNKQQLGKVVFDLQIPQKLTEENFLDVVDDFKKQILAAPIEGKNALRLQMAKYYVYNGMGTEALYILNKMADMNLPESQTESFHALAGIANFLARRWKNAENNFKFGRIPDTLEGDFGWLLPKVLINMKKAVMI